MSRSTTFVALVAVSAFLLFSSASRANVIWSWSFSTESGTFITDGTFADTGANYTFTILHFSVTSSGYPGMVGATYTDGTQPTVGFKWDGAAPTQFFRSSGAYTNGADLYNTSNNWFYGLTPGTSFLDDETETDVTSGSLTIAPLANAGVTAIPTLDTNGLVFLALLLGSLGLAALLLRRT